MEYITTTIGILSFIGILYGLVKMLRESGCEWRWMTAKEHEEFFRHTSDPSYSYLPGNIHNDD